MAEEANLPEEIIVYIISRLPVKSLLKFTSVSKKWRAFISFDPQFRNQLRRNKTLNRRLLACTQPNPFGVGSPQLESLDLETLSSSAGDDSLRRKLSFPFQPTAGYFDKAKVLILGSCNGLVILAQNNVFYVFNPLTQFAKELPQGYAAHETLTAYGFGYISAADEYKVFVSYFKRDEHEEEEDWEDEDEDEEEEEDLWVFEVLSLRDQIWRRIEGPGDSSFDYHNGTPRTGILLNEVLHWLKTSNACDIVTFDLAKEEFSRIRLPDFGQDGKVLSHVGVCFGGCLCVSRYPTFQRDSIDFWVMREYRVSESWTKHITLRFTNLQRRWVISPNFGYG